MKNKTTYGTDIHLVLTDSQLAELLCVKVWYMQNRYLDLSLQEVLRYCIHQTATHLKNIDSSDESK